jgi:ribonuclease HI
LKTPIVVHADEACLGNGAARATPGGAGGLVEIAKPGGVARRDFYVAEPDTTNNRMAIRSAILAIELLGQGGRHLTLDFVSDSEYLVKGMNEWLRGWKRRDWRNVKNPELWQELDELADPHDVRWRWVRGHDAHPKNEYADHLATKAARDQVSSDGLVESGFSAWLDAQRAKGKYPDFDPDSLTL